MKIGRGGGSAARLSHTFTQTIVNSSRYEGWEVTGPVGGVATKGMFLGLEDQGGTGGLWWQSICL